MYAPEVKAELHRAVEDTARAFHVEAVTLDGEHLLVPYTYQIAELGFRAWEKGKPRPNAVQPEFDAPVQAADEAGIELGIEGADSVTKLMLQYGWGTDCSNVAFHAEELGHQRVGLPPYDESVFRPKDEIRQLHQAGDMKPRHSDEEVLTLLEESEDMLSITAISRVFANDTWFIASSADMASPEATVHVDVTELAPCDVVVFDSAKDNKVEHIAVVTEASAFEEGVEVEFWHSWHSRDLRPGGMRRDTVQILEDGTWRWLDKAIANPRRYTPTFRFRRPRELAKLAEL